MQVNDITSAGQDHTRLIMRVTKQELKEMVAIGLHSLLKTGEIHSDQSSFYQVAKSIQIRNNKVYYSGNEHHGVALEDVLEFALRESFDKTYQRAY